MRLRGTKAEISDKKRQFGLWLGLPKDAKEPKTQLELSEQLGIMTTTLAHWKSDPIVVEARESAIKVLGGNDMYEVTKTIVSKAKEGNFQMARLYMEWQGEIGKQTEKNPPITFELKYATKKDRNTD